MQIKDTGNHLIDITNIADVKALLRLVARLR